MNDRELLEMAAKAAEINLEWFEGINNQTADAAIYKGDFWNPLTDDGDALRLAVEVDITIDAPKGSKWVYAGGQGSFSEHAGTDKMAAIRRAIVRAAAEIGRAM